MSDEPEHPESGDSERIRTLLKKLVAGELPLEKQTTMFILASALDVFMTYMLLRHGGFVESNPVADFFLGSWGIRGLIYFKFAIVAFVVVIAQIVAHWKERTARWLLNFGTVVVSFVVVYSLTIYLRQV